jgi:hypothetical protein
LKYVNLYLKEKSRDIEKLFIKWYCLEKIKKFNEAIFIKEFLIYNHIILTQEINLKNYVNNFKQKKLTYF